MTDILCTWGLVDYLIHIGPDQWYVTRNMYADLSPVEEDETDGIVFQSKTSGEAVAWATDQALDDIALRRSVQVVVYLDDTEVAHFEQEDKS